MREKNVAGRTSLPDPCSKDGCWALGFSILYLGICAAVTTTSGLVRDWEWKSETVICVCVIFNVVFDLRGLWVLSCTSCMQVLSGVCSYPIAHTPYTTSASLSSGGYYSNVLSFCHCLSFSSFLPVCHPACCHCLSVSLSLFQSPCHSFSHWLAVCLPLFLPGSVFSLSPPPFYSFFPSLVVFACLFICTCE